MNNEEKARRVAIREALKRLSSQREATLGLARQRQREQRERRKKITDALSLCSATVPELAQSCALDSAVVLREIATLRRYGRVVEVEFDGSYPCYRLNGAGEEE